MSNLAGFPEIGVLQHLIAAMDRIGRREPAAKKLSRSSPFEIRAQRVAVLGPNRQAARGLRCVGANIDGPIALSGARRL
jgi:hypothetical protein